MFVYDIYRSASTKVMGLYYGEIGYTDGKYPETKGENPAEILNGITLELEPYALSGDNMSAEKLDELIDAYSAFQEAFDVDLEDEIIGLIRLRAQI